MDAIHLLAIPRRKPVPLKSVRSTPSLKHHENTGTEPPRYEDLFRVGPYDGAHRPHSKKLSQVLDQELGLDLDEQLKDFVSVTEGEDILFCTPEDEPSNGKNDTSKLEHAKTAVSTALGEVKHFVGGLLSHPFEATKHYAILRHSLGLVYYRGLSTCVTVTIFSDRPLPNDRRLWLQRRGYSGSAGLAIGAAMGTRTAWVDVTPANEVTPDALPISDERAYQRDMAKFFTKAKATKSLQDHLPRETLVIQIPLICEDGYFRIVLCDGRKMLCPSPIFRYASTSCDPSMLRGARFRMLPLELGIKAGAMIAQKAAATASQKALGPTATIARGIAARSDHDVPMHRLGIRSQALMSKEEGNGIGGIYVRR